MWTYYAGAFLLAIFLPLFGVISSSIRRRRILKSLPGLSEDFILGHTRHFANKAPSVIWNTLGRGFKDLGKVWKVHLLHESVVLVADPKINEVILASKKFLTKSSEYKILKNWLGDGLLLSTGKKWHSRRKTITPAFHFKILEEFVEIFDRNSNNFIKELKKQKEGEAVNITPLVTLTALDIICETSMGVSIDALKNKESEYVKAVHDISYALHLRMFDALLRNPLIFRFSKAARIERRALKVLHNFTDSVIVSRRQQLLEGNTQTDNGNEDLGIKKKNALLDILLQATIDGKPLTNEDIREEVDTFMFEGHDTTTSGISFALYLLAHHPKVQEKVIKEIHDAFGEDPNVPISMAKLSELEYFEAVLKEVLRLYPSVPLFSREMEEDVEIKNVKIPKGTSVIVACYEMQRDPDLYEDSNEFKPERFLVERELIKSNPYSYVPFSAGPRNCIGQKFAMMEMKCIVSKVLRNFEISPDPSFEGPVLVAEIVLKPENGLRIKFRPRVQ